MSRPSYLWDPRSRSLEEDHALLRQEPFATAFKTRLDAPIRGNRGDPWADLLLELQKTEHADWQTLIHEELTWMMGAEVIVSNSPAQLAVRIQVFIEYMYTRYLERDSKVAKEAAPRALLYARNQLLKAEALAKPQVATACQISLMVSVTGGDEVNEENESPAFDLAVPRSPPAKDTHQKKWAKDRTLADCLQNLQTFFLRTNGKTPVTDMKALEVLCVDDLVWMRNTPESVFLSDEFQKVFRAPDGLYKRWITLCAAGNLLEYSSDYMGESFRWYDWKNAYAEIAVKWTPDLTMDLKIPGVVFADNDAKFGPFDRDFGRNEAIRDRPRVLYDVIEGEDEDEDVDMDYQPVEEESSEDEYQDDGEAEDMEDVVEGPNAANDLLRAINEIRELNPWIFNPMAVFLLLSLSAFLVNWKLWLLPCLITLSERSDLDPYNLKLLIAANPRELYRLIWRRRDMQGTRAPPLTGPLYTITEESIRHRRMLATCQSEMFAKNALPEPATPSRPPPAPPPAQPLTKNQQKMRQRREQEKLAKGAVAAEPSWKTDKGCGKCIRKDPKDRCVRFINVKLNPRAADYVDYAITAAPAADRLGPKLPKEGQKTAHKEQQYVSPEELGLMYVEPHPENHTVWQECRRDIVRFVYTDEEGKDHLVGGVRFRAYTPAILKLLQDNHRSVRTHGLRRRLAMQLWDHVGSMTAAGSRTATGGRKGDIYGPYQCHSGDSPDAIRALMCHALDVDLLIIAAKSICSDITADYLGLTEKAELNRLGKYGLTCYYCTNFVSCVHKDNDVTNNKDNRRVLHPCSQLIKENCGPDDYNFAMVKWGLAIRTEENTVWYKEFFERRKQADNDSSPRIFDGNDEHGSIMPSASAVAPRIVPGNSRPGTRRQGHGSAVEVRNSSVATSGSATSVGTHATNSKRNVQRAGALRAVRQGYDLRYRAAAGGG